MRRKGLWLALLSVAVVGLVAAMGWVEDRRAGNPEVGWSPLYEHRATDALVPVTSEPAYAGFFTASTCTDWTCDCRTSDDCVTLYCPTSIDLPCEGPEEFPTGDASTCDTCDQDPMCQGSPDQTSLDDLIDAFTLQGATCAGMSTCDQSTCYCPTLNDTTCVRPTCDGPTCGGPTCEGETCFLAGCEVFDYGDAGVNPFYTRRKYEGAYHSIDGVYYLGTREDAESDGKPSDLADGDDEEPYGKGDDEDGAWFPTTLNPGRKATFIVRASQEGTLSGWVDYDAHGGWNQTGDAIRAGGVLVGPAYSWVVVDIPRDATTTSKSFARFRFIDSGELSATGKADNGEVEDYRVVIPATFRAWVMTDSIHYAPGDPVKVSVYLNETAQVTITLHHPDGTQKPLVTTTAEVGLHVFPTTGDGYVAELPAGTSTIEVVATSIKSGVTVWLTTPCDVSQ